MILYTYVMIVIEDKQNRSKQAQHHAVSFYFFLGKFDSMTNMSVLLTTDTELGQKKTIIFQQNKFHIWVDNQSHFYISIIFDININWEEIFLIYWKLLTTVNNE